MEDSTPRLLLLGDAERAEMLPIVAGVRHRAALDLREAVDVAAARRFLVDGGWFPDLIVALQSWSDQFTSRDVLELLASAPLARLVCAYGAWCDSDGRTRGVWPTAARTPVALALERIERELASAGDKPTRLTGDYGAGLARGEALTPLTASRAEVFAAISVPARSTAAAMIAINSPDGPFRRMLADAVSSTGHQVVDLRNAPVVAIIYDADPWTECQARELRDLRNRFPQAAIIAAVGLVCGSAQLEELEATHVRHVWPKMSPLATLLKLLDSGIQPDHPRM